MNRFPRGTGPLISVLLPTRKRPRWFFEAIDSLYSLSVDKFLIEYLIKIDDDDIESQNVALQLEKMVPMKVIVSPRGEGYGNIHKWLDVLLSTSNGDWVLPFGDDARMLTPGWDQLVLQALPLRMLSGMEDVCLLELGVEGKTQANEFILFRKKIFDILGHISLYPHADVWLHKIVSMIHSVFRFDCISIRHFNGTANDEVQRGTEKVYENTEITLDMIEQQIVDSGKLLAYMKGKRCEY